MTTQPLDRALHALRFGTQPVASSVQTLMAELSQLRSRMSPMQWKRFAREKAQRHPVHEMLLEDPLARRAFEKPRGYPGDPPTLDYVLGSGEPADTTALGKALLGAILDGAVSGAARFRQRALAHCIDKVARRRSSPSVLAIGCGHLREGELSRALAGRRFRRYLAIDHDPASLAFVEDRYSEFGVTTLQQSLFAPELGGEALFDLVYVPGAYDYLWHGAARQVTARLFERLARGGTLIVANVAPQVEATAYMEAVMDWWLVHRSSAQLRAVASDVLPTGAATWRAWSDPWNVLSFLEVRRTGRAAHSNDGADQDEGGPWLMEGAR